MGYKAFGRWLGWGMDPKSKFGERGIRGSSASLGYFSDPVVINLSLVSIF